MSNHALAPATGSGDGGALAGGLSAAAAALAGASLSPNTVRTYQAALDRLARAGLNAGEMEDASLASALGAMAAGGAAPSTCALAAAAAAKAASYAGRPSHRR